MLKRLVLALVIAVGTGMSAAYAATIGDDGLHKQDWFAITFRDIREDITDAAAAGKRLVLIFEQPGCVYCKRVHENLLTDPEVRDYIKANFMVVQYHLYGSEEVTDLDGETLTEKAAARKWGVLFTPTILFMPDKAPEGMTVNEAAVATMPGAFEKGTFLDMFVWVREKIYETDEDFPRYHVRRFRERQAAGVVKTD